jgi:hypothetical protein
VFPGDTHFPALSPRETNQADFDGLQQLALVERILSPDSSNKLPRGTLIANPSEKAWKTSLN